MRVYNDIKMIRLRSRLMITNITIGAKKSFIVCGFVLKRF